jgi:hypothetical protein
MNKILIGLLMWGLVAGLGFGAPVPGGKGAHLCLGGNLMLLNMEGGDSTFLAGATLRIDLDLGTLITLAPEVSAGIGGWSGGGTLNVRLGPLFAGAGAVAVSATEGGSSGEWGTNAFLKIHAGTRNSSTFLAASALFGSYIKGFGVTFGWVF